MVRRADGAAELARPGSRLRLGYDPECEIRLLGDDGPPVLLEVSRVPDPLCLATPVPLEDLGRLVEVEIDGRPLDRTPHHLSPGTRIAVTDRRSGERLELVVEPRPAWWRVRRRPALALLALVAVVAAGWSAYVLHALRGAESRITATEGDVRRAGARLERLASAQQRLGATVQEVADLQRETERRLRADFDASYQAIRDEARVAIEGASGESTAARAALESTLRARIAALREETSDRLVDAYRDLRAVEARLLDTLAANLRDVEPTSDRLKRVYQAARGAVAFVRTTFVVEFARSGERMEQESGGTGFVVSPHGLALTARHVVRPWEYDRELLVLLSLDLARVDLSTVRWTVWVGGSVVLRDGLTAGYASDAADAAVRLLHAPTPLRSAEVVDSPLGPVPIERPAPGPSDVAVLQLVDFERRFEHLAIGDQPVPIETLDEVLVIGFPFMRLSDGTATAQAVRGSVRQAGRELLELDVPLHPGQSGGPVVDRDGRVVGLASAVLGSALYGIAVRDADLGRELAAAREAVLAEEARLRELGCPPGVVDGEFDADTWAAYRCEAARGDGSPTAAPAGAEPVGPTSDSTPRTE